MNSSIDNIGAQLLCRPFCLVCKWNYIKVFIRYFSTLTSRHNFHYLFFTIFGKISSEVHTTLAKKVASRTSPLREDMGRGIARLLAKKPLPYKPQSLDLPSEAPFRLSSSVYTLSLLILENIFLRQNHCHCRPSKGKEHVNFMCTFVHSKQCACQKSQICIQWKSPCSKQIQSTALSVSDRSCLI